MKKARESRALVRPMLLGSVAWRTTADFFLRRPGLPPAERQPRIVGQHGAPAELLPLRCRRVLRVQRNRALRSISRNLFDRRYTVSAHNNNILPGAPRTVRFQVIARF